METSFEKYILEQNNLAPYGEEDWNDESIFRIGDIVVCLRSHYRINQDPVFKGKKYKIENINVFDKNIIRLKNKRGYFLTKDFKKVINEQYDLDPYGEEEWDDRKILNDKCIQFTTYEQRKRISEELIKKGFEANINNSPIHLFNCFVYLMEKIFILSNTDFVEYMNNKNLGNIDIISYDEFMEIINDDLNENFDSDSLF